VERSRGSGEPNLAVGDAYGPACEKIWRRVSDERLLVPSLTRLKLYPNRTVGFTHG